MSLMMSKKCIPIPNFMNKKITTERILGIDPGFGRVGYGVIEKKGGAWVHVAHGCIETSSKKTFVDRLKELHAELAAIIRTHHPTSAAMEELFFYKNVKTAIDVGQARGVLLLTCIEAGLSVVEFTPLQIKQAMTGYGRAEKQQIQAMVALQLHLPKKGFQDDAADALAVALTAGVTKNFATYK